MLTESEFMPGVRETWEARCRELGLKAGTKKRESELSAFAQGALAMALAGGLMDQARCNQIAFVFLVGRGEEFFKMEEEV